MLSWKSERPLVIVVAATSLSARDRPEGHFGGAGEDVDRATDKAKDKSVHAGDRLKQ